MKNIRDKKNINIFLFFYFFIFYSLGKGATYGYDAVGSFKRDDYGVMGSGQNYLMPILDNMVYNIYYL